MKPKHALRHLLVVVTLFVAGCRPPAAPLPRPLATNTAKEARNLTMHQAGKVLAGTTIRHTFRFRNSTESILQLAQPGGIQPSCGCARATVADDRLVPGQSTSIEVLIRTEGREGNLSEVVETGWNTEQNERMAFAFEVRATVVNGLVLTPGNLTFAKHEVKQVVVKQVRCTSDLPIAWNTATAVAEADYLEVGGQQPLPNGEGLRFDVACLPTGSGVSRQDHVLVQAEATGPNPSSNVSYSIRLPVYSIDPAPLRVNPAVAILRRTTDGPPWSGTLFVTGDAIAAGANLRQIRSDTARITFCAFKLTDNAIRLDLDLWPRQPSLGPATHSLELVLTTGEKQRTKVRLEDDPRLVFRHNLAQDAVERPSANSSLHP